MLRHRAGGHERARSTLIGGWHLNEKDLVDAFIRDRGVTHCPAAAAAPTSATISSEDVIAHGARGPDPVGDAWRKKNRGGWSRYWAKKREGGLSEGSPR